MAITTKALKAIIEDHANRSPDGTKDYFHVVNDHLQGEYIKRISAKAYRENDKLIKDMEAREAWLDSQGVPELPIEE